MKLATAVLSNPEAFRIAQKVAEVTIKSTTKAFKKGNERYRNDFEVTRERYRNDFKEMRERFRDFFAAGSAAGQPSGSSSYPPRRERPSQPNSGTQAKRYCDACHRYSVIFIKNDRSLGGSTGCITPGCPKAGIWKPFDFSS
jgi:hypothetical protein